MAILPGCPPAPGPDGRAEEIEVREEMQAIDSDHTGAPGEKLDRARVTGNRVSAAAKREGADPLAHLRAPDRPINRENYLHFDDTPIRRLAEQPVSTFSIDGDTRCS